MPLNISHAEDAWLGGNADWEEFIEKFDAEFYAPVGEALVGAVMATLPPEVLEQLKVLNPDAVKKVLEKYGGTTNAKIR